MATIRERLREIDDLERAWRLDAVERDPALDAPERVPAERVSTLLRDIDGRWARFVAVAWIVLFTLAIAIQPAPADASAPEPFLGVLLSGIMLAAFVAALAGLAVRRAWGMHAAVAASVLLFGLTLACPATGHHELAGWWYGQLAFAGALGAVSVAGLRRA